VVTHAGCHAVFTHPRCKTGKALKRIAGTGGYTGIYTMPFLLGKAANLETFFAHLMHAVKVVGAEHVAIGTDYSVIPEYADLEVTIELDPYDQAELSSGSLAWSNFPLITVGMVQRGIPERDIRAIMRGNILRVLSAHDGAAQESIACCDTLLGRSRVARMC